MRVFIVILGLLFVNGVIAEPLKVVTDEWEGYTSKEGKGYYMDLLRAIYNDPADSLNISVLPYARSLAMVKNGTADMVLGVYFGEIPNKHMAAYVVEQDLVDVVVSSATAKDWKGMVSLEGKAVLAKIGYAFDAITDVKMKYTEKTALANMLKMVSAGRADAVLDYKAGLEPLMEGAGLAKDKYTIIESVLSSPIYFGFADTPKGIAAKATFEKRFKELYESGDIKKMMESNLGHSKGLTKTLQSWK
ncbi:MAG: transporter substrate-binding domain-containing protein [Pseudomonadales bacterium]|nr:transporter substrate-binding domain-containing protein [Pseudomonadales bacterium]